MTEAYDAQSRNLRDIWKDMLQEIQSPLCTKSAKNIYVFLGHNEGKKQFSNNNRIHLSLLGMGGLLLFLTYTSI